MENLYEILQCAPSAPKDELRRSYTRLARKYHPDKKAQREAAVNDSAVVSKLSNPSLCGESGLKINTSLPQVNSTHLSSVNSFPPSFDSMDSSTSETEEDKRTCLHFQDSVLESSPRSKDALCDFDFVKIDKAWKILGNDDLRAQYDIMWKDRCLLQEHPVQENVPFEEFEFQDDEHVFLYPCRCGGEFLLTELERQLLYDFVCCDTCSLIIKVCYD